MNDTPAVSIVMPCLNEEETIAACITKAETAMKELGYHGEVVVGDNGSTDHSVKIAGELGARVVHQPIRGYGAAYLAALDAARGEYIVMGDSDDTYDFTDIERFLTPLRSGCDFVMGSRFDGEILPGAMPWSHRYIGNPVLSGILRWFFGTRIADAHCGMRSLTRDAYQRMELQTTGMEFASEMVVKAVQKNLRIAEVPITYHPRAGQSKLNSFRDAWRHMRFMLLFSPTHLFALPGLVLFLLGMAGMLVLLPGPLRVGAHSFDVHVMTLAGIVGLLGYQILHMGLCAKAYAVSAGFDARDRFVSAFYGMFSLERGILAGSVLVACGLIVDARVAWVWMQTGFGALDEVRAALFALVCMVMGVQTVFTAFMLSLLAIPRRRPTRESDTSA